MSVTEQTSPPVIATARTPGYDVARALAVLGMALVNYKVMLGADEHGDGWLLWLSDRVDGRAAALFVVLAGVGISLRSRRAREDPEAHLSFERRALLKRAAVLFVAGLLNLHLWEWDILHCYGLFLAVAALLLTARGWLLGLLAVACTVVAQLLQLRFDHETTLELWTPKGFAADLFFNGMHPFFPWMSFLLVGMWLGRRDLRDRRLRRVVLILSLTVASLGELVDSFTTRASAWLGLTENQAALLSSWPRPPQPVFVVTAAATAIAAIGACIALTQSRPRAGWVVALTATGQLAFTLYIAHAIAIVIPQMHGLLIEVSIEASIAYALGFYAAAVAASLWWRRRFAHGPLEALIRQVTGRTTPAPWGGELARAPAEPRK